MFPVDFANSPNSRVRSLCSSSSICNTARRLSITIATYKSRAARRRRRDATSSKSPSTSRLDRVRLERRRAFCIASILARQSGHRIESVSAYSLCRHGSHKAHPHVAHNCSKSLCSVMQIGQSCPVIASQSNKFGAIGVPIHIHLSVSITHKNGSQYLHFDRAMPVSIANSR